MALVMKRTLSATLKVAGTQTREPLTLEVWGCSDSTYHSVKVCLPGKGAQWAGPFHSWYSPYHAPATHRPVAMKEPWKSEVTPIREDHFSNKIKASLFSSWAQEGEARGWSKDQGTHALCPRVSPFPQGPLTLSWAPPAITLSDNALSKMGKNMLPLAQQKRMSVLGIWGMRRPYKERSIL